MSIDFNAASKPKDIITKPADVFNLETLSADLEQYRPRIDEVVKRAGALKVSDDTTMKLAIEMGMQVKRLNKNLADEGERIFGPYNKIVRGIRAIVNPFKKQLTSAEQSLKAKISRYQSEQAELARRIAQKKAAEEAAKRQAEAEAERQANIRAQEKEREEALARKKRLDAEAKKAGVAPVAVAVPEVVDPGVPDIQVEVDVPEQGATRTAEGTSSTVKTWKHRLVDIALVPDRYVVKSVNDKLVREAIKAGVRTIEGLEIYEHIDVRFRAK